jgi:hypothetical protein
MLTQLLARYHSPCGQPASSCLVLPCCCTADTLCEDSEAVVLHNFDCKLDVCVVISAPQFTFSGDAWCRLPCRRGFGAKVVLPATDVLHEVLLGQPATVKFRAYHIGEARSLFQGAVVTPF